MNKESTKVKGYRLGAAIALFVLSFMAVIFLPYGDISMFAATNAAGRYSEEVALSKPPKYADFVTPAGCTFIYEANGRKTGGRCRFLYSEGGYTYAIESQGTTWFFKKPELPFNKIVPQIKKSLGESEILGKWGAPCGNTKEFSATLVTGSGAGAAAGSSAFTTTTTSLTSSSIASECTPGVDCPDADLGNIIQKYQVRSAYANSKTNTCPFFWTVGNEDADKKISCKIITGSKTTNLPNVQTDGIDGYPLPVGRSVFICTRGDGVSTSTESHTITCNPNPNVKEI